MFGAIRNNAPTLRSLHSVRRAQSSMDTSVRRLSTGLRINSAKDDPAGMIAATQLSSEIVSIQSQRRADQMDYFKAMVADGAYGALGESVRDAQAILLKSQAGPTVSADDRDALQAQLDAIVAAVDHFAGTLTVNGTKLLDGSTSLGTAGTPPSATNPTGTPSTLVALRRTDAGALGAHTVPPPDDAPDDAESATYTLKDLATGGRLALIGASGDDALSDSQRAILAQKVIDSATNELATRRADVGAFMRYTVETYGNVLDATEENLQAALSQIQDADYAAEVANYVRQRSLVDANLAVMAHGMQESRRTLALLTPLGAR